MIRVKNRKSKSLYIGAEIGVLKVKYYYGQMQTTLALTGGTLYDQDIFRVSCALPAIGKLT
jgi:hypothetical protein